MSFVNSQYLYLAIIACILTSFLCSLSLIRKRKWLKDYKRLGSLERLGKIPRIRDEILKIIIISSVVLGLGLVLLGPIIETTEPYFEKEKLEFIITLDGTISMLAEVPSSRLDIAKREIKNLTRALEAENLQDLVGLVVFTNKAFLLCPPTYDYEGMFLRSLDRIDGKFLRYGLPQRGTNIGEGLRESLFSFSEEEVGKVLILLTDGESKGEASELEASMADAIKIFSKAKGISVYIIGVGEASRSSYIPTADGKDYERDPKTNRPIRTRPDPGYLRRLARRTGGLYIHSATGKELRDSLEKILKTERKEVQKGTIKVAKDITQYILGLVLVLLFVYCILTLGKPRKESKRGKLRKT